jgi:hypothetical protein
MPKQRKKAESREKDLRMAILRIKHGRSHAGEKEVSIAAVAREAGVSTALIHNCHPKIADAIRTEQGRESRSVRDAKLLELREERAKSRELRQQIEELRDQVTRLSSINETLLADNETIRTRLVGGKVVQLRPRATASR